MDIMDIIEKYPVEIHMRVSKEMARELSDYRNTTGIIVSEQVRDFISKGLIERNINYRMAESTRTKER